MTLSHDTGNPHESNKELIISKYISQISEDIAGSVLLLKSSKHFA